jgi:hypothetical protein
MALRIVFEKYLLRNFLNLFDLILFNDDL